jgi:hypothetical protein
MQFYRISQVKNRILKDGYPLMRFVATTMVKHRTNVGAAASLLSQTAQLPTIASTVTLRLAINLVAT